jgi:hypothetical protein
MTRALQFAGLAIGVAALILQFVITVPASIAAGRGLAGSVVFYLSFFTILTNIGAVLVHIAWLGGRPAFFRRPSVRACMAVSIATVMVVYHAVLARLWQPEGLFLLCDVLLHTVTPLLYLAWWLLAGADGSSRWRDVPRWMVYPLLYLAYALARGRIAGEVPYPFLDVSANGAGGVALASLGVFALFLVLSMAAILADRAVSRFRNPSSQ